MKNKNEKIIYSRRMAYKLRTKGYKIIRVEPSYYRPELDCYVFEKTDSLIQDLNKLINE